MLQIILTRIMFTARNVKATKTQGGIKKPPNAEKIKLTEEQLTDLGTKLKKDKPSIREVFAEKYSQKFAQFQDTLQVEKPKKKTKTNIDYKFYNKPLNKHIPKEERIQYSQMTLKDLSSVRLGIQYLPISYLKQAQKIFHKYGQKRLRQLAEDFSKLMRLRYSQEKLIYDEYQNLGFLRLQQRIPKDKQIEQIYLIGEAKIYDQEAIQYKQTRSPDDDPINPEVSYTQNIVVSYLLNRSPRTFATAIRMMTEIKYKYPDFKPESFLDFGGGLASGAAAFIDIFEDTNQIYCVQPSSKMRKLGKYLTEGMNIKYYQTLGEMSTDVKQVDIVYSGYVINQIKPELVEVYLEALYNKVKNQGFLVFTENGSPFGARMIHETRNWAIKKGMYIAAPCPHSLKCPLRNEKSWCHFDQPSGMYPSQIFGKLPTDQAVKLEKISYLILQKQESSEQQFSFKKIEPNITKDWDRVIFPVMKRGQHTVLNLCTKFGTFQRRISAKSHGPEYKEIKKLKWGDYWRFGKRIPNKYRKQRKTGKRLW